MYITSHPSYASAKEFMTSRAKILYIYLILTKYQEKRSFGSLLQAQCPAAGLFMIVFMRGIC